MNIDLFGYKIKIEVEKINPGVKEIKKLILTKLHKKTITMVDRISAIKILRQPEISAMLIEIGNVPPEDVRKDEDGKLYVGLNYAKSWMEFYFLKIENDYYEEFRK
jgi:hypothetical protein